MSTTDESRPAQAADLASHDRGQTTEDNAPLFKTRRISVDAASLLFDTAQARRVSDSLVVGNLVEFSALTERERQLVASNREAVGYALFMAENEHMPSSALERLAHFPHPAVRIEVGLNPSTPTAVLRRLLSDQDPTVRYELMVNPDGPRALRHALIERELLAFAQVLRVGVDELLSALGAAAFLIVEVDLSKQSQARVEIEPAVREELDLDQEFFDEWLEVRRESLDELLFRAGQSGGEVAAEQERFDREVADQRAQLHNNRDEALGAFEFAATCQPGSLVSKALDVALSERGFYEAFGISAVSVALIRRMLSVKQQDE